ncbi:MAG: hypothetical protein FWE45_01045 [Firmicutes bacterium]|nr:hypothetical protein [Bacillota bacterium]
MNQNNQNDEQVEEEQRSMWHVPDPWNVVGRGHVILPLLIGALAFIGLNAETPHQQNLRHAETARAALVEQVGEEHVEQVLGEFNRVFELLQENRVRDAQSGAHSAVVNHRNSRAHMASVLALESLSQELGTAPNLARVPLSGNRAERRRVERNQSALLTQVNQDCFDRDCLTPETCEQLANSDFTRTLRVLRSDRMNAHVQPDNAHAARAVAFDNHQNRVQER